MATVPTPSHVLQLSRYSTMIPPLASVALRSAQDQEYPDKAPTNRRTPTTCCDHPEKGGRGWPVLCALPVRIRRREGSEPLPSFFSSVDRSRYRGDYLFSTEVVKNRSPRSSCGVPARVRCGGGKDEGSTLSDEHKLDTLPPLPHLRLIHRHVAERSSVRRVMSSSCSQPSPTKE